MRYILLGVLAAALAFGCTNDPPTEPKQQQTWIPAATAPETLLRSIEIIYDDKRHTADERVEAFGRLLAPDFGFGFQAVDWDSALTPWGYEETLKAHRCLFEKLTRGTFLSLRLDLQYGHATDLDLPDPARKNVFASNVFLELLRDPNNGWVVNGGQATFRTHWLGDHWAIDEWRDLPRPRIAGESPAAAPSTWGQALLAACH